LIQYKNKLIWLLIISTLVRCIIAASIELGNDEVYYLTYAQHLQWNYFDHPPMVALLIRCSTFNLSITNTFFIRLGAVILAAVNTFLIFNITTKIKNEQAGFFAALLFTASPYCSIIAGTFILPDSVQLFFWIVCISLLVDIVLPGNQIKERNKKLLLFGLFAGLCIMSKIHGIFLWLGFGIYILTNDRSLLSNRNLYFAAIITSIIISPILIWNIQNHFITYSYHSERVSIHSGFQPDSFLREIAGGIFYNNPVNYFLIIFALIAFFKRKSFINYQVNNLLLQLSFPLILLLMIIASFRDTLPHWSGPAYTSLIIIAACYIGQQFDSDNKIGFQLSRFIYLGIAFLSIIIVMGICIINYFPGTFGKKEAALLGDGDFTLDMYGWKEIKREFKKIYTDNKSAGKTSTTFVISNKWFPAAHIDNYIAQPLQLNFIAIGELNDIHTYNWLNQYRKKITAGDDAYFITVSNVYADPHLQYQTLFESIGDPAIITIFRNGKPAKQAYIYLLKHYKGI
jgi:hypothetical protein